MPEKNFGDTELGQCLGWAAIWLALAVLVFAMGDCGGAIKMVPEANRIPEATS